MIRRMILRYVSVVDAILINEWTYTDESLPCWSNQSMAKFASIAKQLSSEQSRLSSDDKHLQRDEKLVQEERKDLEMSISEQTADLEKQRDKAR
jgi:outer membrane murein-binding lipoprotein Lpp